MHAATATLFSPRLDKHLKPFLLVFALLSCHILVISHVSVSKLANKSKKAMYVFYWFSVGGKDQALTVKLGRVKPYSPAEAAGLKVSPSVQTRVVTKYNLLTISQNLGLHPTLNCVNKH